MTFAILFLTASASFAFGWALRTLLGATIDDPRARRRIILDWGAAHRLLDHAQVCRHETDLAPRVRWLLEQLAKQVGWPTGREPGRKPEPEPDDDKIPWVPFRVDI